MNNAVFLEGNLGADPDLKHTSSGSVVATLNVAFYNGKDQSGNAKSGWVKVTGWNKVAERMAALKKGDRITLQAKLNQDSWEDPEGNKRNVLTLVAFSFSKIDKNKLEPVSTSSDTQEANDAEEDLDLDDEDGGFDF